MKTQTLFALTLRRATLSMSLAVLAMIFSPAGGMAQSILTGNVTLFNDGSSVGVNLGGGSGPIGVNDWTVDTDASISQLNQQWFWYSINTTGLPNGWSTVQSIDALPLVSSSLSNGANSSSLNLTYENSSLAILLSYTLQGAGSGSGGADLNETVNILNVSGAAYNIDFYQYGNFNLLQNNLNVVNIGGSPTGGYSFISQTTSSGGNGIEETINQPYANYAEAGDPTAVLGDVTAGNTLNDHTSYGPADAAWALEFSSTLNPFNGGNAWNVLQDQNMSIQQVPEPTSVAWLAMGIGIFGFVRRAWKRSA